MKERKKKKLKKKERKKRKVMETEKVQKDRCSFREKKDTKIIIELKEFFENLLNSLNLLRICPKKIKETI